MKSYRVLAWKELLAQKVTSILILIAVILSTVTTTVIGQSIGVLNAMRQQQAITINGEKYATFLQMSEAFSLPTKNWNQKSDFLIHKIFFCILPQME